MFEVLLSQGRPAPELVELHDRVQVTVYRRILKPEVIDFIAKADQTYQLTQRERIAFGLFSLHEPKSTVPYKDSSKARVSGVRARLAQTI